MKGKSKEQLVNELDVIILRILRIGDITPKTGSLIIMVSCFETGREW
jgi:hypothetical protein